MHNGNIEYLQNWARLEHNYYFCAEFLKETYGILCTIDHDLVTLTYAGLKQTVRWKLVMVINIISTRS